MHRTLANGRTINPEEISDIDIVCTRVGPIAKRFAGDERLASL